ncbi:MAG TPA: PP2C family serine/threonine-protein phosphatase, partial [Conexibacter sp.]|nr:PP2C family serine/threonine-protein phosphatase [Conexibacter sp.]
EERVREANRRIHDRQQGDRSLHGMGTTITAAYLDEDELSLAHVGDSRAYLLRDGELSRLTRDHTLVEELVRRGELTEQEAAEHPQRSIITRALGPEEEVEIDLRTHRVQAGDLVLLCSDGLTGMIDEAEVAGILLGADSLGTAGRSLVAAANDAGGRDNITVVLFRLEEVAVGGDGAEGAPTEGIEGGAAAAWQQAEPATADRAGEPSGAGLGRGAGDADRAGGGEDARARRKAGARTRSRQDPPASGDRGARTVPPRGSKERAEGPLPRRVKLLAATAATVIVLGALGIAGWLASRAVFFLGTNDSGVVTIYRGLPWELPAGIHLYEQYYVSGVPASVMGATERERLLDHRLRSRKDARDLISELELGQLDGLAR